MGSSGVVSGGGESNGGAPVRCGDPQTQAVELRVRPIDVERDYDTVVPLWQRGFLEMSADIHARLRGVLPAVCAAAALLGACAAAWPAAPRGAAAAAAVVAASAAALASEALGGRLLRAALWQGILRQTARDMTRGTLAAAWCVPGASAFLVAEDARSGRVLGCVAVRAQHTLHKEAQEAGRAAPPPGEASVWRLSVAPEARRAGVGRALMRAAETWARARGCAHISLVTGNTASKVFYRQLGYELEDAARAARVLFGPTCRPSGLLGWLKSSMLHARLSPARGTVFCKALAPGDEGDFSFAWLAGLRVTDDSAGVAARAAYAELLAASAAAAAGCAEGSARDGRALAQAVFLAGPAPLAMHRQHLMCLVPVLQEPALDASLPAMVEAAAALAAWRRSAARRPTAQ